MDLKGIIILMTIAFCFGVAIGAKVQNIIDIKIQKGEIKQKNIKL